MWCMSNSKPTVHSGRVTATCWLTGLRCERRRSHVAGDMLPSLLLAASRATATTQWPSWSAVRRLAARAVISAEAAKAVSQHGAGLVRMPQDMVSTLDACFRDAGLTGRTAKQRGGALTERLKALSRSTAVGGLQPYRTPDAAMQDRRGRAALAPAAVAAADNAMTHEQLQEQHAMDAELEQMAGALGPEVLADVRALRAAAAAAAEVPLPRTRAGRLKASARAAVEAHIAEHGTLGLPHEAVRLAFDLPPSSSLLDTPDRLQALKHATPSYSEAQALAYAVSRLPACFAAASRIFRELGIRLPAFKPKSLLDYGAGPGTAAWAAQEVWPSSLTHVTAVEPSAAMQRVGMRLEAARRFAHPTAPLVRWRAELPAAALSGCRRQQQQKYDVVVASYVLCEVPTQAERAALLRRLWGMTGDMLVLVEPGTPAGSANIQEARAGVLQYEARRVSKLQQRMAGDGGGGVAGAPSERPSSSQQQHSGSADHNLPAKAASKWFGAHVVAPCPHDGMCPLAAASSKAWCHFGTRFQRPGFMQEAKAPAGHRVNPSDFQDERYSYVVLRRGARPAAVVDVDVSRSFAQSQRAAAGTVSSTGVAGMLHLISSSSARSAIPGDVSIATAQHAQQAQQLQQAEQQPLLQADELLQLNAVLGPLQRPPDDKQQQQQQQQQRAADTSGALGNTQRANRLHGYGFGFVGHLMALEDAGVDWAGGDTVSPNLLANEDGTLSSAPRQQGAALASHHGSLAGAMTDDETDRSDEEEGGDSSVYPQAAGVCDLAHEVDLASTASVAWSRIIRQPRRRGGHVILDVCSPPPAGQQDAETIAGGATSSSDDAARGSIVRHVVARSDAAKWMGQAAYRMAKDANWGDLWPTFFCQNPKQQTVK